MFNHKIPHVDAIPALQCPIEENVTLLPMLGDITGKISHYALGAFAHKKPLPYVHRMISKDTKHFSLPYVKPWHISHQEVIYGGIFFMHWGHFLLENLQRLWYAKKSKLPIVWIGVNGATYTPSQFKPWQNELFQILGIDNEHIFLTEPTQFAKVHFPEPGSGISTHIHPEQAHFLRNHHHEPISGKYVYFSRAKIRSCANEDKVELLLKKRGWRIVYPEKLSVEQQLKAMGTAEVCFMIGGSAQHSLLLSKQLQTRFVVIPREHGHTYNIIANHSSDNYHIFHAGKKVLYTDFLDEANDAFALDLEHLEHVLVQTKDFTQDLHMHPELFTKPAPLVEEHLAVPAAYYKDPIPCTAAQKLYAHALFLYQRKKYTKSHRIFKHLEKKKLLEDYMYENYCRALQQYHIQQNTCLTLPMEKHQHYIQILQNELAQTPQNLKLYKKLTQLLLIEGKFAHALQLQEKLAKNNPQWSKPLAQIASIYHAQKDLDMALTYAQKAVEVEPYKLKRKKELASYLFEKGDYNACKKLVATALLHTSTWDEGYALLAAVHHKQGALDKALACIEKAVHMAPENLTHKEQWATYLTQSGHQKKAIDILSKAMQGNPRHAERFAQNAAVYAHMGQLPKAIEHARKAVEMEPRNFVCKSYLATYLRQNKDYDAMTQLMTEALHTNPFWSEPHAQWAAQYAAQGNLPQAIDHARKAVAIEPYDKVRKQELEQYRVQWLSQNTCQDMLERRLEYRQSATRARIQSYIDMTYAQTYLEIGVFHGRTFLQIDVPFKVGVDPNFRFTPEEYASENIHLYSETSDVFFEHFPQRAQALQDKYHGKEFKFDVIFIDGLHTFEQTLRDFENSLPYAHEKTLWIIDDTVPNSVFSAMNSHEKSLLWKACAGMNTARDWHGDVFKAIFAIHDTHPEFSYCTQIDDDNPQTILWRTKQNSSRQKALIHKDIHLLRYEDFIEYAWVLHPVENAQVVGKFFQTIDPLEYKTGLEYTKVIRPLRTDQERIYAKENHTLKNLVTQLQEHQNMAVQELKDAQVELVALSQAQLALQAENAILKRHISALQK